MDKYYTFDEINGSLRPVLIKNKYVGYFTNSPVDRDTVPKTFHVYEVSMHPSLGMPESITRKVKNRKHFYGTILTTEDLGLTLFKPVIPLKTKDGDLYEFMFGHKNEDGEYEVDGCLTDIMPVWAIDKFMTRRSKDSAIIPFVQELDDDGNVIEEREMTEEEFHEFLEMQTEAANNLADQERKAESKPKVIFDADPEKILPEHSKLIFDAEFDAASSQ